MRRPFSLSSPSSGWTSGGIAESALLGALVRVLVVLFGVELGGDAAEPHLVVLPAPGDAHPNELREERQGVIQLSHRPADVVQTLDTYLLAHALRQPPGSVRNGAPS